MPGMPIAYKLIVCVFADGRKSLHPARIAAPEPTAAGTSICMAAFRADFHGKDLKNCRILFMIFTSLKMG